MLRIFESNLLRKLVMLKEKDPTCIGSREMHTEFCWGNLCDGFHLEGVGVCRTTVTLDLKETGWDGVECVNPPVDRDVW